MSRGKKGRRGDPQCWNPEQNRQNLGYIRQDFDLAQQGRDASASERTNSWTRPCGPAYATSVTSATWLKWFQWLATLTSGFRQLLTSRGQ